MEAKKAATIESCIMVVLTISERGDECEKDMEKKYIAS